MLLNLIRFVFPILAFRRAASKALSSVDASPTPDVRKNFVGRGPNINVLLLEIFEKFRGTLYCAKKGSPAPSQKTLTLYNLSQQGLRVERDPGFHLKGGLVPRDSDCTRVSP